MIRVDSIVKLDFGRIRELSQDAVTALEQTADKIMGDVRNEQVIPWDTGTLQGESMHVDNSESQNGKVSIIHSTPYARRLYFHPEYNFQKDENPNAKGKWFADWESGGKYQKRAMQAYKEIYRRLSGL